MTPNRSDRTRQLVVTVSEVACILGTLVGTGVIGTRVARSSGGALSADATLLAPAGPAFSIWSVIYLGLAAYTVWQWFPSVAVRPRVRRTGYLVATSMLLNATWLLVTQQGWIWLSVVVILALAIVLGLILQALAKQPPHGREEQIVLDGTIGLYTGWVSVAAFANVAAAGTSSGLQPPAATWVASAVLLLVIGLAWFISRRTGTRWTVALAMAWGLGWLAFGRLTGEPESALVGVTAVAVALGVLAVTLLGGRRSQARTALA